MAQNSKIEWTDHTFNPWWGCAKVSQACKNCYAETFSKRVGQNVWGAGADRRFFGDKHWNEPRKWNTQAEAEGVRRRVFCASMADVFEEHPDEETEANLYISRQRLGRLIRETPALDWLLLTKRPENGVNCLGQMNLLDKLPNVWIGTTVENQEYADKRIPELLRVPAAVRFLSVEPLLGPVHLRDIGPTHIDPLFGAWLEDMPQGSRLRRLDWVIAGGESGHGARPMHPDWLRSLRDQCQAAGVPFFFKQWGDWLPWNCFMGAGIDDDPEITKFKTVEWESGRWEDVGYPMWCDSADGIIDDTQCMGRVGKKSAGRLLGGVEHNGFPEAAQ